MKRNMGVLVAALILVVAGVLAAGVPASAQAPGTAETSAVTVDHSESGIGVPGQQTISAAASPGTAVSFHKPDGMILSTGNLYFTSHDVFGAHVFRTAQTSVPGQEIELYHEPPGSQFGDIVFAQCRRRLLRLFLGAELGNATIKRILLTGSQVATVLTPPINDIDIVNSHHNLATDGVSLYWQEASAVKKMAIGGGPSSRSIRPPRTRRRQAST